MKLFAVFMGLWKRFFDKNTTTTTSTITTVKNPLGSKKAICIGINDYPGSGNDLRGCVNDARNWASLLKSRYGFNVEKILLDNSATKASVTKCLIDLIATSKQGDMLVVTYSGHGTTVRDTNGDEEDGKDEAWCLYDGNLIDDDIRNIISKLPEGVKFSIVSDSCFSGTISRAFMAAMDSDDYIKARYMPPQDDIDAFALNMIPLNNAVFVPRSGMKEILISGCMSTEYSYDAHIGGQDTGAFSYYAIDILKNTPNITYEAFYAKLREKLPTAQYPQTPQLEGSEESKKSLMFQ